MITETKMPKRQEITPFDQQRMRCATQKCQRPLTKLGDPWNCYICLHCNSHPAEVNKAMAKKYPDQDPHTYVKDHVSHSELDELVAKKVAEIMAKQNAPAPPKYEDDDEPEFLGRQPEDIPDVASE